VKTFYIPCPHELNKADIGVYVDNYFPLTRDDVEYIVEILPECDLRTTNDIQCRLSQAVPGNTCPHELDTPTAKAQAKLDKLFVDHVRAILNKQKTDPEIVDKICELLGIKTLAGGKALKYKPHTTVQLEGKKTHEENIVIDRCWFRDLDDGLWTLSGITDNRLQAGPKRRASVGRST
jgi:hypothetical protein